MLAALAILPVLALCFSQSDLGLFKLRQQVIADLGEDTTFYSWLGLKKGADHRSIQSAYRKLSRAIHPDRNPGQAATERFARLNEVYKILRSPLREQYDHYLRSGFPQFDEASDEYRYRRFRPGVILAVILVALLYTAVEVVVRKVSASRQRQHLENIIDEAQTFAKASTASGVITQITSVSLGSRVFSVHPDGSVYFLSERVDPSIVPEPTWQETTLGRLIAKVSGKHAPHQVSDGQVLGTQATEEVEDIPVADASSQKSKKTETEILKKGAARRRTPAARGKAKLF